MSSSEKRVGDDRVLLDLLADKWTIHVLGSLCDHGYRRRFNAIRRDVPGLSRKSLVQCLRRLEKSGLVARTVLTTGRLGVEYAFTDLGRRSSGRSRRFSNGPRSMRLSLGRPRPHLR
jgi:DNA-binding HxlR family transcriptional regulator